MARVLVSLLSDQSMPNIRFIKENQIGIDNFVFIGTNEMKRKNKLISYVKSLNISLAKTKEILVDPFNISLIEEGLLNSDFNEEDEYIVNITGGTKPMSIACLSFFSYFVNVTIYYVAIGDDFYRQIYPRVNNPHRKFEKSITLKEYFTSYQLELLGMEHKPTKPISAATFLMHKYLETEGNINKLPEIKNAHKLKSGEDRAYFSGGWFEEYVYWAIKKFFHLSETQIAFKVELQNEKSKNEYDVVFIYQDEINIVECKAYFGSANTHQKIEKDLYKLSALGDDFGLKVQAIYITTFNIKEYNITKYRSLKNRAQSLQIKSFQFDDLIKNNFLTHL